MLETKSYFKGLIGECVSCKQALVKVIGPAKCMQGNDTACVYVKEERHNGPIHHIPIFNYVRFAKCT